MNRSLKKYLEARVRAGTGIETLESIRLSLDLFCRYLKRRKRPSLKEASTTDVLMYFNSINGKVAQGTLNLKFYKIRDFYKFALKKGWVLRDPLEGFKPPGLGQLALPEDIPSETTIERILKAPNPDHIYGMRSRAILELMYSSGLRSGELRALTISDIDLHEKTLKIRPFKRGGERIVPFGNEAARALERYLHLSRPNLLKDPSETRLFVTSFGRPLCKTSIQKIIARYNLSKVKIHPHTLRHACALHMLRHDAPITVIQELLGHKTLKTTEIYTRLCPNDVKLTHLKYHPRQ